MEWTWREQLMLLLQCGGLGMLLGVLYDWLSVFCRLQRLSRAVCFVLDALFGLVAALVTFFFSLATMDGRLHPLLFCGTVIGLLAERSGISRWHRRGLYRLLSLVRRGIRCLLLPLVWLRGWLSRFLVKIGSKIKKLAKNPKKFAKRLAILWLNH